jgi:hypothetical protein
MDLSSSPFPTPNAKEMEMSEGTALKYFMWAWQIHFRISASVDGKSIFERMDTQLDPNVFLVGFLQEDRMCLGQ